MRLTNKNLRKMIIEEIKGDLSTSKAVQEEKTGSPYYGDEHHEKFDFSTAPYQSFLKAFNEMSANLTDLLEADGLSYNEIQYVVNDMIPRIEDSVGYLAQVASLKLKKARNEEPE